MVPLISVAEKQLTIAEKSLVRLKTNSRSPSHTLRQLTDCHII